MSKKQWLMTVFDVRSEIGNARELRFENLTTPILLKTNLLREENQIELKYYFLGELGIINLNIESITRDDIIFNSLNDDISQLENWAILSPRLKSPHEILPESIKFELNLFLERLEKTTLPRIFGFTFDPINFPSKYLDSILDYHPSIIVLQLPDMNRFSPRKIIHHILELRRSIPPNVALYFPNSANLGHFGLLFALGIDIFDDSSAYRLAAKSKVLTDGFYFKSNWNTPWNETVLQNLTEIQRDFEGTIYAYQQNRLWTRIERDMHIHPNIATGYRIFSREFINLIGFSKFPVNVSNDLPFTGEESLLHPDVLNYREKIISNYQVEESAKVILLIPCSAKKPYSESKSHKRIYTILNKLPKHKKNGIFIWSLTSPLGVVPEDIEMVYPAMNYDIPVTGEWSQEESRFAGNILADMLKNVDPEIKIIVHVSKDYQEMVNIGLHNREYQLSWIDSRPTSKEALNKLHTTLEDLDIPETRIKINKQRKKIDSLIKYNHGPDCTIDFTELKSRGRPPKPVQFTKDGNHWLSFQPFTGSVSLSLDAAREIKDFTNKWVSLDVDELKGSTIFAVGLDYVSPTISPLDEVLILTKDKNTLLGIGTAIVSGNTMKQLTRGPVIKIRKKQKAVN